RALGFGEVEAVTLADHFLDAERTGRLGHGLSRIEWLETLDGIDPAARPVRDLVEPGYERWRGNGALGYLVLAAVVEAQLADPPPRARARSTARSCSSPGRTTIRCPRSGSSRRACGYPETGARLGALQLMLGAPRPAHGWGRMPAGSPPSARSWARARRPGAGSRAPRRSGGAARSCKPPSTALPSRWDDRRGPARRAPAPARSCRPRSARRARTRSPSPSA